MRHGLKRNKLNKAKDQQIALMRSLSRALLTHGQICTTLVRAKVLRSFVEKILTKAIKANLTDDVHKKLHFKRLIMSSCGQSSDILHIILQRAVSLESRSGGYTRILKLGKRRGDNAEKVLIQILDQD